MRHIFDIIIMGLSRYLELSQPGKNLLKLHPVRPIYFLGSRVVMQTPLPRGRFG
jgi:hypothetical protein